MVTSCFLFLLYFILLFLLLWLLVVLLFCKERAELIPFSTELVLWLLSTFFMQIFFFSLLFYQGNIQQLLILEDPQAAARYCVDYIPNCDSALPYSIQALTTREVSTVYTRWWWFVEIAILFMPHALLPFSSIISISSGWEMQTFQSTCFPKTGRFSQKFEAWGKLIAHMCFSKHVGQTHFQFTSDFLFSVALFSF